MPLQFLFPASGAIPSLTFLEGAALETLVFQELLAVKDLYGLGYDPHYWRTGSGLEAGLIAIEVKRAAKIRNKEI